MNVDEKNVSIENGEAKGESPAAASATQADSTPNGQAAEASVAAETPKVNEKPIVNAAGNNIAPIIKTFTQEDVNGLVGKARIEGHDAGKQEMITNLTNKYGIKSLDDFDDYISKAQQFDYVNNEYKSNKTKLADLESYKTLVESKIDPNKFDDVKFYFKGKGADLNPENISNELVNHPEWVAKAQEKAVEQQKPVVSKIIASSAESSQAKPTEDELSVVRNLFKGN